VQWADDPWSIVSRIPDCTAVAALRCKVSGRLLVAASMVGARRGALGVLLEGLGGSSGSVLTHSARLI
jgi:hypothetical protein